MTGTSIDGLDAALVRIEGRGWAMRASLLRLRTHPLTSLAPALRAAADQEPMTAGELARLALDFGSLHADAVEALLRLPLPPGEGPGEGAPGIDLIAMHGQTIFHQPPVSWQLINPAPVAARFGCPVVYDLRHADLAAGGQGAPITPLADWILFRHPERRRAIVNLGGFCNVTLLPRDSQDVESDLTEIRGFDVCACNQVLDAVAREALGVAFDDQGKHAQRGRALPSIVESLSSVLAAQRRSERSLGTGDEVVSWVKDHAGRESGDDLAASAAAAIAKCIAAALAPAKPEKIILAGGGARNLALVARLRELAVAPVSLSDEQGVPIEAREAMAMAVLGALCADGMPITLPQVTGCRAPAPISGSWYGNIRGVHT
jgi:1,6-anhydro-N-acetylmuramate kinase